MNALHYKLLTITGPDAEAFLQGQLTVDVTALNEGDHTLAATCNNKGRVIANMILTRHDNGFSGWMTDDASLLAESHLSRFAAFSKVTLTIVNPLETEAITFNLPGTPTMPINTHNPIDADAFYKRNQSACLAFVDVHTSGKLLPSMLNMDALGGVDYEKGCYVGQEIIARTHYRGTVKRHLQAFKNTAPDGAIVVAPGLAVW